MQCWGERNARAYCLSIVTRSEAQLSQRLHNSVIKQMLVEVAEGCKVMGGKAWCVLSHPGKE
jgi:hypothetical protein